jgi:hypothetical protein
MHLRGIDSTLLCLKVVFEPNAQGSFKEVLEVVMTDATVGAGASRLTAECVGFLPPCCHSFYSRSICLSLARAVSLASSCSVRCAALRTTFVFHSAELWSRPIVLTGIGHSPRIRGFPKFVDFGNIPVGFMVRISRCTFPFFVISRLVLTAVWCSPD